MKAESNKNIEFQCGYLLVRTFQRLYAEYQNPLPAGKAIYSIPRKGVDASAIAHKYRGIDRAPLEGLSIELMTHILREVPSRLGYAERAASLALHILESQGRADSGFLFSLEDARDAYTILGGPADWEIIWASCADKAIEPPPYTERLGFEPSWFYGDHFSAVCDCMCFPRWHGTDTEGTLFAEYHAKLNENALFDAPEDADGFLRFYRSLDWTETGDYSITEVRALRGDVCTHLLSKPTHVFLPPDDRSNPEFSKDDASVPQIDGLAWQIVLQSCDPARRILAVKALRDLTGIGIAEAKRITENLPIVLRLLHIGEKEGMASKLAAAGFVFKLESYF
jgi:hypothetical protein